MRDSVELTTPHGPLRFPIVGIIKDYSQQEGTVFLDRSVMKQYWNDDTADIFRIYLKPDATPEAVRAAILARFEHERRLFVLSTDDARQYVLGVLDQWFAMTYIQIAIAVLVAVLGILNTLTVSITERKRELGVLRAIGGMPGQIRRTIWMEAFAIGTIGLILGFVLGAVNLYYTLVMVHREITGFELTYEFPWRIGLGLIPVMLLAALLVATGPAEYAVHTNLVEALEYE
jgi:putative ABC transport system permease protein